ncbi:MAG: F0F1 ATP synthase subunit delta [Parcubacteria group bacterium]|nr:F0F1 ATP synthase subunit delta [Parcubacteria group bacterium]
MQVRNKNIRRYASALAGSLAKAKTRKEAAAMLDNFFSLVKRRGHAKFLRTVLIEVQKKYEARGRKPAEMVSAAPLSSASRKKTLSLLKRKGFGTPAWRVSPELLAGSALFLGNEYLMDGTLREKLRRIFL